MRRVPRAATGDPTGDGDGDPTGDGDPSGDGDGDSNGDDTAGSCGGGCGPGYFWSADLRAGNTREQVVEYRAALSEAIGGRRRLGEDTLMPVRSPKLRVAFDCEEDWSQFRGEGSTRLCERCVKQVHDLSAMTRSEARTLLAEGGGRVCVRFTHDGEGRVLFRSERDRRRLVWQRFVFMVHDL